MEWFNFFDGIYVLNLDKREDRLIQITEDFENFEIPFERIKAIEKDNGAEGLRDSVIKLFNECIEKNYKNILLFEDDCKLLTTKDEFHNTMNAVVKQLPENYIMCFLGAQVTGRIHQWYWPNIFLAHKIFSTHSVMYSQQGMREIVASNLQAPIDNYYVEKIEPLGGSYCTYPLLTTQYAGFSDIGRSEMDWSPFIQPRYEQKINEYRLGMR